ncbi:MAG TPA: ATP-binding protein [Actinomycetota bacterium]|nr:ATP-binding protein [Actinomycetota bacterium]
MTRVQLEIPPSPVYAGVARLAVAALARSAGFNEDRVEELKIAAGEACANAVLHNEGSGTPVVISWVEDPEAVVVEVADRGTDHDADEGSERMAMSMALLQSLVDAYEVSPRDGGGMCARLTLRRP